MDIATVKQVSWAALIITVVSVVLLIAGIYYGAATPLLRNKTVRKDVEFRYANVQPPGEVFCMEIKAKLYPGGRIKNVILKSKLLEPKEHSYEGIDLPVESVPKIKLSGTNEGDSVPPTGATARNIGLSITGGSEKEQAASPGNSPVTVDFVLSHIQVSPAARGGERGEIIVEMQGTPPKTSGKKKSEVVVVGAEAEKGLKSEVVRLPLAVETPEKIAAIPTMLRRAKILNYAGLGGIGISVLISLVMRQYYRNMG